MDHVLQGLLYIQNGLLLDIAVVPKVLDEQLRNNVEIFLVLMENRLHQLEYLANICQLKFVIMD